MKRQNSILDDEKDNSVAEEEEEDYDHDYNKDGFCDNDDDDSNLSGFETAVNTLDFEQDERPPMLRLLRGRNDSNSYESRDAPDSKSKTTDNNDFDTRLSTGGGTGYSLADSIRYASLPSRNGGDRKMMLQETQEWKSI